MEVRSGKVVAKPVDQRVEQLLAVLENRENPDYEQAIKALGELPAQQLEALMGGQREKLRRLAGDQSAEARRAASGRPPKLTLRQEREVLRWFRQPPTKFGFTTELWTAPRGAELMLRKFRKRFHPRYLNQGLAQRRITPQKPSRQARERNEREIRRWLREEWPRIKNKKGRGVSVPIWS